MKQKSPTNSGAFFIDSFFSELQSVSPDVSVRQTVSYFEVLGITKLNKIS